MIYHQVDIAKSIYWSEWKEPSEEGDVSSGRKKMTYPAEKLLPFPALSFSSCKDTNRGLYK